MSAPQTLPRLPSKPIGTTGHEWDGIEELNTPLPRWWLWVFYATIIWSIGYWVVYPAWPLVSSYTQRLFDWNTRSSVAQSGCGASAGARPDDGQAFRRVAEGDRIHAGVARLRARARQARLRR